MQGIYILFIEFKQSRDILIGKRGKYRFAAGYYAYVGSALNNLVKRIERHLRADKKLYWHIDYLLNNSRIRGVVYAETDNKLECIIAKELLKILRPIQGFGCSDCKCEAHLFYHDNSYVLREAVLNSFRALKLTPVEISAGQSASKASSSRSSKEGSIS